jgi:hypothetical protein
VQEVLIDRNQLVPEDSVEMLDNADIAFHGWPSPALYTVNEQEFELGHGECQT